MPHVSSKVPMEQSSHQLLYHKAYDSVEILPTVRVCRTCKWEYMSELLPDKDRPPSPGLEFRVP